MILGQFRLRTNFTVCDNSDQGPHVQDGAVLHGHHGGPHCHPQAQEAGHGEAAQNPENTHHFQTSGYLGIILEILNIKHFLSQKFTGLKSLNLLVLGFGMESRACGQEDIVAPANIISALRVT